MPEGRGQEELPHIRGREQRPRVPDCDGAGTAERSYPTSEVREGGQEELPHVPTPKARAAAGRSNPMSKEPWLRGCRRA